MRCLLPIFLGVLLCAAGARGQGLPRIRHFEPGNYQSQNQNWSLAQDPVSGWIYAGNNGGLLEFDGARWTLRLMPEKQTVRAVAPGPKGLVFCGGFAEFGYWENGPDGRATYHSLSAQVRTDRLAKEEIWHILVCPDYVLFQSFSTIYKYDYRKVTILHPPNSIMFAREVAGQILVPVIGRGIYELLENNTFRLLAGTEPLADKIVQFLVPDGAGGIWAGTTNHGIFQIGNGQCHPWDHPLNTVFKQNQLNKAVPLSKGGWAIGTILDGVYILDAQANLRYHLNRENGLQNNTVLALFEDRGGNLWAGLDRGIDFVALRSWLTFFTDQSGRIGTVYTAVRWNDRLYIGTNQGVFERAAGGFHLVEGTQGQVWQLQVLDGQLLCGHNAGTFILNPAGIRKISDYTGGWCTVPVPGHPELLVQGSYTGLVVFRKAPGGSWQLDHRVEGFIEPLKKIDFDTAGNLWGAHPNKGLFRLRLNADFTQVLEIQYFSREDELPSDFQLGLVSIGGKLILNTHSMPLQISEVKGRVRFQPFAGGQPRQLWLPGYGNDYFTADSSGVVLHTPGGQYSIPVQLVPNFEHIAVLSDWEYLFCLDNGFALLDKRRLKDQPAAAAPACAIRLVETSGGFSVAPSNAVLEFGYSQNNLRFHFAVPHFERPPLFSWKMDGFAPEWSAWQSNPEKEFINLPSGRYTLRVRSDAGGGEASVTIHIGQPWYWSNWAIFIYTMLLLGLLGLLEKMSRHRLERQRLRLVHDKEQELAQQRSAAEREKLALEVENKSRELNNAALNLIRKNEVLQRLRDDLLRTGNDLRSTQKLARMIDQHLDGDHDWVVFEESFNRLHDDFFKRLMNEFQDLTPGDLRLAAYLKMNLSSKEIAPLLNISVRGVENKRYRLRKKLGLPEDANLTEYMIAY